MTMTENARVERGWRVYSIKDSSLPGTDEIEIGFGGTEKATLLIRRSTAESDMLYEAMKTRARLRITLERMEEEE